MCIWLASAASTVTGFDFYPKAFENRNWAPLPAAADLATPSVFIKKLDSYWVDHFGLRSSFIRLHNILKFAVFKTSPNDLVLLGKDGQLFWYGQESLPFYRNVAPFTPKELEKHSTYLKKIHDWLQKRKIAFLILIPPDPPSVYGDKLPDWVKIEPGPTRRQQLITEANRFMTYPILDLVPVLTHARAKVSPYFTTDSHWNNWGGYVSMQLVFDQLRTSWPPAISLKTKPFSVSLFTEQGRDLARSIGLPDLFTDTTVEPLKGYYKKTNILNVHDYDTVCESCINLKVLVVRDSYGEAIESFLSSNFRHVIYVWDNAIPFARIEQEKPDVVLFEFVERKLRGLPLYDLPF